MPQLSYRDNSARSLLAGLIAYGFTPDRTISRLAGGGVAQVTTVQVTGVVNSVVHSLLISYDGNTETVSFTADGSATNDEVAAGLEAAIDADPNRHHHPDGPRAWAGLDDGGGRQPHGDHHGHDRRRRRDRHPLRSRRRAARLLPERVPLALDGQRHPQGRPRHPDRHQRSEL
jgi:hypothetical protein